MSKDPDYRRMINTSAWRKLRRQILSGHPTRAECAANGRVTLATEVHHIVPVESAFTRRDKMRLMFNPSNLMPLCHPCHVSVHTGAGRSGRKTEQRRAASEAESFGKKFFGEN